MKFHFESNLQYQLDAIEAVVNVFEGAPFVRGEDNILAEVFANKLIVTPEQVTKNVLSLQRKNHIPESTIQDSLLVEPRDFTIEMETGTGKTYVYLRTILELNKKYGVTKFIIVVPSIAVREGVLKTLAITKDHFKQLYDAVPYEYYEYTSKKLHKIRQFVYTNTLQIMVMNMQAFNTDDRVINQERDTNNGEKLLNLIKQTSPILILDEPQEGMDTENMIQRFVMLNPLYTLRYSATHKKIKNLIYRLTPFDAYNQRLVKKIEVFSIHETNTQSNVEIQFSEIKLSAGSPQARLQLSHRLANGEFTTRVTTVKKTDDLESKTKNPIYHGWIVERIHQEPFTNEGKIQFSNGKILTLHSKLGWDKESIFKEQIRWSIRNHFAKKEKNALRGVKTLALFFIDRVANYVGQDGIIRRLFEELYIEEYTIKYGKKPENREQVHNGYFAKTHAGDFTDSENAMQKNKEIYDKILKDKEKLLSFADPLEFIFSHSALGVGWDNPNIFTICTLNETNSAIKKRQEIGRGLRICVDQQGQRIYDADTVQADAEINLLTVIANQSYHAFVASYQQELLDSLGEGAKLFKPSNARKNPTEVRLNKTKLESVDFKNFWSVIAQKTKIQVYFSEEDLIDACVEALHHIVVPANSIAIDLNRITSMQYTKDALVFTPENKGSDEKEIIPRFVHINLINEMAKNTSISMQTARKIWRKIPNKHQVVKNPMVYLSEATRRIKKVLHDEMVRCVRYEVTNDSYDISLFEEIIKTQQDTVRVENSIYDKVIYDASTEKDFALDASHEPKVKLFLKLPLWYTIETPIGAYHPDWGLIIEKIALENNEQTRYYFVVETKGSLDEGDLREKEWIKIQCAMKHFEAIGLKQYFPIDNFKHFKEKANIEIPNLSI